MRDFELNPAGFGAVTGLAGCLTWDIAQLATGQLDVERNVVPFDEAWVGSVTVDRAALHQVRTDDGWGAVLLPAPESGAVYFEGRRLVAGDAVLLPPDSDLELLSHAVGRVYLIAFRGGAGSRVRLRRPRWYTRADGHAGCGFSEDLRALLASAKYGRFASRGRLAGAFAFLAASRAGGCGAFRRPGDGAAATPYGGRASAPLHPRTPR